MDDADSPDTSAWARLRRLPLPLQVLLAWAAFRGMGRVATTCLSIDYGESLYGYGRLKLPAPAPTLRAFAAIASLGVAALLLHSVFGVLRRRSWGPRLLAVAYALDVAGPLLEAPVSLYLRGDYPRYAIWVLPMAIGYGFWVAVVASYLVDREVLRTIAGRPTPERARGAFGHRRPSRPLTMSLLVLYFLLTGLWGVVSVLLAGSMLLRSGAGGWGSPLTAVTTMAAFALTALTGVAGFVGAVAVLGRHHWGRWVLMGVVGYGALSSAGGVATRCAAAQEWAGLAPALQGAWTLLRGLADAGAHAAFVIAYLCTDAVRQQMRASTRRPPPPRASQGRRE